MPQVAVVQHLEPEAPYAVATALARAGVGVATVRVDRGEPVPAGVGGLDGVVVMGGPASAGSDDGFPSRAAEVALLRAALDAAVPVLGVCLGAQLLAVAAGGAVRPGPAAEIGWGPVALTAEAAADPLFAGLGSSFEVLHWHGETYDLPPGAVHLARSDRCEQQAFRVGPRAWGLQFHLEVDEAAVAAFAAAFPGEAALAEGGATAVVGRAAGAVAALEPVRDAVLGRWAACVAGG